MSPQTVSLNAVDLVLRVAAKSTGASEHPPNTNSGPYVERVLASVGLSKGQPWCAADVYDTGHIALGPLWPGPKTGGCQALYEWGVRKGIVQTTPQRGDIFVVWHPELGRFAHTGFIITVIGDSCTTHEGNTSGGGSREGWMAAERSRVFGPKDRFLRWVTLL